MSRQYVPKTYDELLGDYVRERTEEQFQPVRLGFGSLDADIRGISAGQVCGICARTAVGKTWVLNAISRTFAQRRDVGSLVLSLEMPGVEWAERQVAVYADVSPEEVEEAARRGDLGRLAGGFLEEMTNSRVYDEPMALAELPAAFRAVRASLTVPLRLVMIDYLGLLGSTGRDAYERASALGKGLKEIAKRERVAVVVAMQLSRTAGDGSEPVSIDQLRDSGVLEESLDFLIGCWRPGKAKNLGRPDQIALRDTLRVALLKNRKGQDGRIVDLCFQEDSRRVYEPVDDAEVTF
jgi:replicative DNA helicase